MWFRSAFAARTVACASAALLLAACNGNEDDEPRRTPPPAEEAEEPRRTPSPAEEAEEPDRNFDKGFDETSFERLLGRLPLRKPPLYVQQIITESPTHKVHTRVDRRRFICAMTVPERKAAVESYYRAADRLFRESGIHDYVQFVSPLTDTAELRPALAVGRDRTVTLTRQGLAKGPC